MNRMKNQEETSKHHDPYAAFRYVHYRAYFILNFLGVLGSQMTATAVGWQLYIRTHQPLTLGLVGLAMAVPHYLLFLPAGNASDRHDRKKIFLSAQVTLLAASLILGLVHTHMEAASRFNFSNIFHPHAAMSQTVYLTLVYGCLFLMGGSFAFLIPAKQSMIQLLVPRESIPNAVAWNSSAFQVAAISGPVLAGLLLKFHPGGEVFFIDAGISLVVIALLLSLRYVQQEVEKKDMTWDSLVEGVRFVKGTRLLLAAITLDLFAVLFGGATALLPIYAVDILHGDSLTLGYLRAAICLGAIGMAMVVAHRPLRRAGKTLLWAVAGYGLATIVFGFSKNLVLSLCMMALLGALDNISVILRGTLVQMLTPNRLMGRVQAVNFLFITSSNELGAFESGTVAAVFGTVFAVVSGGVGTILVVLLVAKYWPELRKLDQLDQVGKIPDEVEIKQG
jgi:MFS family permease